MIIKLLNKNLFFKNVSTLAIGTILSQLILFVSTPILTRLYSAADFGVLALFTSISTIVAILTTGRYELAIGLPEKDEEGANIAGLTIFLSGTISIVYFITILIIKHLDIGHINKIQLIHLPVSYLIPVFTFLAGIYSSFQYWNQRKKKYKRIALGNMVQILTATFFYVVFGLTGFKNFGLIWGLLIGQLFGSFTLFLTFYHSGFLKKVNIAKFKSYGEKYSAFPKYMIISDFSLTVTQQIIPIIFSILFNASIVGYFSLANRLLRIPSIVLTSSIGNVFRNEAIDIIRADGNCRHLYLSTLKKLVILSAPIYIFIFITAPWIFALVFGKNWIQAGYFAQIICLMLVFDFISTPLNTLFYVLGKQKLYMTLQFFNSITGILAIVFAYKLLGGPFYCILFFVVNSVLFNLITLYLTYNFSQDTYKI